MVKLKRKRISWDLGDGLVGEVPVVKAWGYTAPSKKVKAKYGPMEAYAFNPKIQEAEAGGSL